MREREPTHVLVDQCKRRASHHVPDAKAFGNPLGEHRLAGAKVAFQQDGLATDAERAKPSAEAMRLSRRMADDVDVAWGRGSEWHWFLPSSSVVGGERQAPRAVALTITAAVARSSGGGQPRLAIPDEPMQSMNWTAGSTACTMTQGTGASCTGVRPA